MKRIAFIVPWGEALGGAERMLLTLLRHLDRSQVEPTVFFLKWGSFEDDAAQLGVATAVVPAGRLREVPRRWVAAGELARQLDAHDPDVVCAWAPMAHVHSAITRRRRHRPRSLDIWWQHGISRGQWHDRVANALPAAAVGCSSQAGALAQRALRPRRRTFVVHPGSEPHPHGPPSHVIRDQLEIPPDRFVIGITGRLQPWKNHPSLLAAVATLRAEGLPAHALIVGGTAHGLSASYPAELDDVIQRLGLSGHVTRTGHVSDAPRLLPAMDVLVNASDSEPFGISLIEAMAAGLPVVAVNAGGPAEIVEDRRSGLLVASSAPADLAGALRTLGSNVELRARLGAGALQGFREHFTATHMARAFERSMDGLERGS